MTQLDIDFTEPKLSRQEQKFINRLKIGAIYNYEIPQELHILSYTKTISKLRRKGYEIGMDTLPNGVRKYYRVN